MDLEFKNSSFLDLKCFIRYNYMRYFRSTGTFFVKYFAPAFELTNRNI